MTTRRRYEPIAGFIVGGAALLFGLFGLVSGKTYAFMGRARAVRGEGFWISRAEKPNLYWWNQAIYFGTAVVCMGAATYLLRERDGS